jgi:hypothetical protein
MPTLIVGHDQLGVVLHLVLRIAETAVELIPDFPVLHFLVVAINGCGDVIAPELNVLDGELASPAIGGGPGGKVMP